MTRTFDITISSATSAYLEKEPIGYPILNRKWNRADQCIFFLQDFDKDGNLIDMDPIQRGDEITLEIDGNVAFFGEVIEKKTDSTQDIQQIVILAQDFLRLGSEYQINRDIYNGLIDQFEFEIDENYKTEVRIGEELLDESALAISIENYQPFGSWVFASLINIADDTYRVYNDTITERRIAFIFTPERPTMTGVWIAIWDPEDDVGGGSRTTNTTQVDRDITVSIRPTRTISSTNPLVIPDEMQLAKKRSGNSAVFAYDMDFKTTWRGVTGTNLTTGTIGNNLVWTVAGSGGSNVDMITGSGGGHPALGWGDNFARLNHAASGSVSLTTTTPVSISNQSDSGWLSFQFTVSTSNDIGASFEVYMRDVGPTTDRLVASVDVTSGNMILNYGESQTFQFITGYSTTNAYYLLFRFNKTKGIFDMWYDDNNGTQDVNEVGWNFPIINRNNWNRVPTQISQLIVKCDGSAAGDLDLGFVNGNEIGSLGSGYQEFSRWAYIDMSSDPVYLNTDQQYAVVLTMGGSGSVHTIGTEAVFMNRGLRGTFGIGSDIEFRHYDGTNWVDTDIFGNSPPDPLAIVIRSDDSWRKVAEGEIEFQADAGEIIWDAGPDFSGVINSRQLQGTTLSGSVEGNAAASPNPFPTARVVFYTNPDSASLGIVVDNVHSGVYTSHRMTVADVVKQLGSEVPDWGSIIVDRDIDGSDDAIDVGWHDDSGPFRVDQMQFQQRTISDAMRHAADLYGAVIFISQDSNKDVTFQLVKSISDITSAALLDPSVLPNHEYILSTNLDHNEEYLRIITNNIGLADDEIYTDIIVKGSTPDLVVHLVNWELYSDLGNRHIVRKPEVFSKETNIRNLINYASLLESIYSKRRKEGIVKAAGYLPLFNNRLDINGIFRVIDEAMEDGDDTTGTNNVFKIAELTYDGSTDTTDIFLTNSSLNREAQQKMIIEMLDTLNQRDPATANKDMDNYNNVETESFTPTDVNYMALIDSNGNELDTPGYTRQETIRSNATFDGVTTYYSYLAHFPAGVGTIPNDQCPITEVKLFDAVTGGTEISNTTSFVKDSRMYKWSDRTLTFTYWVNIP